MSARVALATSVGLFAAIIVIAFIVASLAPWAGLLALGCFLHCGGDTNALKQTIGGNLLGIAFSALGWFIILNVPSSGDFWMVRGFLATAVTVMGLALTTDLIPFTPLPAALYGYAALFAYMSLAPDVMQQDRLLHVGRWNPIISVAVSMVLGAVVGLLAKRTASALGKA